VQRADILFRRKHKNLMEMQTEIGNGNGATLQQLIKDLKVVVKDGEALLKTGAAQLKEKATARAKATDQIIRKNPYPSIGVIFSVGLVLGILACSLMGSGSTEE
jgi:ElaB/YqjD/DUF883 family membrane-anchored ribosome-binding protein